MSAAVVFYGLIGVFTFRVVLDIWLLAGAILLVVMVTADRAFGAVRATQNERARRLPGDELLS